MAYIKFKEKEEIMQAMVLPVMAHVVRITTDAEPVLNGFRAYLDEKAMYPLDNGEYESYTTLYRQGEGWYELSNDGSVYQEVAPLQPEETRELTEEEKAELERQQQISSIRSQISNLKAQISDTDYQVIKTYEYSLVGIETDYDINALHQQRQSLRDQINALETKLAELTAVEITE